MLRQTGLVSAFAASAVALGCSFGVQNIPVYDDGPDSGVDGGTDSGPDLDGASQEQGDAGDDAAAVEPARPIEPFKDDFQRADRPADGPSWKDAGPGAPDIWNGELCLQGGEQARTKLQPAAYGHVQVTVRAFAGFELHLEADGDDMLVLRWDENGDVGTRDGLDLVQASTSGVHAYRFELDYKAQSITVQVDGGAGQVLAFETPAQAQELWALRFNNSNLQGSASCADNVLLAKSQPLEDAFEDSPPMGQCAPGYMLQDCIARHCCAEQIACDQNAENCTGELSCSGCTPSDPSVVKLAECMARSCAGMSNLMSTP